jgi:dolichol kinase
MIEGVIHDLTGIALFIVAVALMLASDGLISVIGRAVQRKPSKATPAS